jgi:F-type H+-transporting ATPase subunit epsilon
VVLAVEIVTPEATLRAGPAAACVARSSGGFFTVLSGHADLVTDLVPGVVRVAGDGGETGYLCHGGFLQVRTAAGDTDVRVLVGVAEPVSDIDVARATTAKEQAQAALSAGELSDGARHVAEAALARADLRLEVASAR